MYTLVGPDLNKQRNLSTKCSWASMKEERGGCKTSVSIVHSYRTIHLDIINMTAVHCQKVGAVVSQLVHTFKDSLARG